MNRFLLWLVAVLAGGCVIAPEPTRLQKDELAPTGVLRVAVFTGNPVIGRPDPLHGEPTGPTAMIGRALAEHAGMLSRPIEYTSTAKMVDDARAGAWDVAAVTCEPARPGELEYTLPYLAVGERGKPVAEMCLVLPKGRSAARDYVAGFVLRAKSQGTIARAIEQSGLRGVYVAP
jgi:polar amino acid transport system substrate-binding protein